MLQLMRITILSLLFVVTGSWVWPATASTDPAGTEYIRTQPLVKLAPTADKKPVVISKGRSARPDFDRIVDDFGVADLRQIFPPQAVPARLRAQAEAMRMADHVVIRVPDQVDPDRFMSALKDSRDVESVEFDRVVRADMVTPNDPYFATHQYSLRNTGAQPPYDPGIAGADVEMEAAWAITTGDTNVVLSILDTGIDFGHPDLQNRRWINPDEEFDDIDNDSNGFVDDVYGWNFIGGNNSPIDDHEHGTHVAGIAAANGNNGVGIAGMNWNCRLMPVKVLDATGSGTTATIAGGLYYAANEGADIVSMSLGYLAAGGSQPESLAVAYALAAGVTVVAAMGNNNVGTNHYPAAYPGVISVGATDSDDRRAHPFCYSPASGSNYGSWIDVCAPGDNVWSTLPAFAGNYGNLCGTSMATPHVAGLAALIKGLRPDYTTDSIRNILCRGAEDQVGRPTEDTPGFDIYHGWGRINGRITLQALVYPFPPILTVPGAQIVREGDTIAIPVSAFDSNLTDPALSMSPLTNAAFTDHGDGSGTILFTPDYSQEGVYHLTLIAADGILADTGDVEITVLNGCQCPCIGDPQCNSQTDVLDVVAAVGVAFRGQPSINDPDCFPNPGGRTDVDCNGVTDVLDVVDMVGVAFRGQAANFCNPCG